MDSWSSQTASPDIKFENSPAESFLSAPGEMYPSLFGTTESTTMNPLEIMTPQSFPEDKQSDIAALALSTASTPAPEDAPATTDKKQSKKRKSWGQVLPEPKTNLPPRKRAKTDDEKEQRRVERVLRNRRAAQSSRERKRLEVEALEKRNKELEAALLHAQKTNLMLAEQLNKFRRDSGVASSAFDSFRPNPITFSQELFGSQDGHGSALEQNKPSIMDELLMSAQSNNTVNPASLSPALSPVPEEETGDDVDEEPATTATPAAEAAAPETISPDVTQHPAEMLCSGLQCQSAEMPQSWLASQQPLHPALALYLQLQVLLTSTSTILSVCQRPLTQIAMSLKAGFSLPPTRPILNTIIWLVTQPSPSRLRRQRTTTPTPSTSSTSTNSSTTTKRQPHQSHLAAASQPTTTPTTTLRSTNLRLKSLRKILTCSPVLARPLMDATMEVLRLVSSEGREFDRVADGETEAGKYSAAAAPDLQGRWLNGAKLPSKEVLLTLLWALKVEERRLQIREGLVAHPVPSGPGKANSVLKTKTPTDSQKYVLKVVAKRGLEEQHQRQGIIPPCGKRRRIGQ